jgi:3-oxoacyl-[acyl-carrier protein] reductase
MNYLITGGSRGLGFEYAKHISYQKQDRNQVSLIVRRRKDAPAFIAPESIFELNFDDLTDSLLQEFENWLRFTVKPDVVIHCAGGGLGIRTPMPTHLQMQSILNANLIGAIAINSIILPSFISQKKGTIIHIGSTASTHAVGSVAYNTAKAGLAAYVRSAGNHFVKEDILICGINPGAFMAYDNSMSRLRDRSIEIYAKFIRERLPRGQMMPLGDLFSILDFLCRTPNLSLAGSMISIDAGESLAYP